MKRRRTIITILITATALGLVVVLALPQLRYHYTVYQLENSTPDDVFHWIRKIANLGQPTEPISAIAQDLHQRGLNGPSDYTLTHDHVLVICKMPSKNVYLLYHREQSTWILKHTIDKHTG